MKNVTRMAFGLIITLSLVGCNSTAPKIEANSVSVYLIRDQEAVVDEGSIRWRVGRVSTTVIGGWRQTPNNTEMHLRPYVRSVSQTEPFTANMGWENTGSAPFGPFYAGNCYLAYFALQEVRAPVYKYKPTVDVIDCDADVENMRRDFDLRTK